MEINVITQFYTQFTHYLTESFGPNFVLWLIVITTVFSIAYFIIINYAITHLDTRYFIRKATKRKQSAISNANIPILTPLNKSLIIPLKLAKIVLGLVMLVCGLAMLVLPGQGILTIVIALSLLPFPGKYKLIQYLLARKSVRSSLNWIRSKAKKEPFLFDDSPD